MWRLAESPVSIALLESFYNTGKPIALVCHSPGGFRHVTYQVAPPRCLLSSTPASAVVGVSYVGRGDPSSYWPVELPQLSNQIEG
jgi:hypothetical protein